MGRDTETAITVDTARIRVPKMGEAQLDYGLLAELTGFPLKVVWIIGYTLLTRYIEDPAVTPQRFSMLELIGTNPGLAQTQLGAALGLSRPATTLAIDFWQERGCVERRTEPNDRRSFGIYLTDLGQQELARLRKLVKASDKSLTQSLTEEEITEFRRLLAKIHG